MENEKDILKELFDRLPEERLPEQSRDAIMARAAARVAARKLKRSYARGIAFAAGAGLLIIAVTAALLYNYGIEFSLSVPDIEQYFKAPQRGDADASAFAFWAMIAVCALALLLIDMMLSRKRRKHNIENT